jgi:hypothetical protein
MLPYLGIFHSWPFHLSYQPLPLTMSRPTPFDDYCKHPRRLPRTMLLPQGAHCYVHTSMAYETWEGQRPCAQAAWLSDHPFATAELGITSGH